MKFQKGHGNIGGGRPKGSVGRETKIKEMVMDELDKDPLYVHKLKVSKKPDDKNKFFELVKVIAPRSSNVQAQVETELAESAIDVLKEMAQVMFPPPINDKLA